MSNDAVTQQLYDLLVAQLTNMSVTDIPAIEDVTFGAVTLYAPGVINLDQPTSRNSSVLVSYGEEPVQQLNLHYNRLHLPTLIGLFTPGVDETFAAADTVHDVLAELGVILKCELTADDLEDLPLETNGDSVICPLVAKSGSLLLFGEARLAIAVGESQVDPEPEPEPPVDGGDDGEEPPAP